MRKRNDDRPVYLISVVCDMLGVHPQTLRLYERAGLINPRRMNKQRLYSDNDIEKLKFIVQLTKDLGVNRAGVDIILRMRYRMEVMHHEMLEMMNLLEDEVRKNFSEKLKRALEDE